VSQAFWKKNTVPPTTWDVLLASAWEKYQVPSPFRSIPNLAQTLQIQSISYRIRGQHHTVMLHPWVRINRRGEARHGGSWYERRLDGPRGDSSPPVLVLPATARRHEAATHASLLGSSGEERQREMDGVLPAGAVASWVAASPLLPRFFYLHCYFGSSEICCGFFDLHCYTNDL
jgi:hypothetical protein